MKRSPLRRKTPLKSKAVRLKPGPKPRKRPPMKRCDDLARKIVLARPHCEGRPGHTCKGAYQWAHIQSRSYHWIRHLEENALKLCQAEHFYFTKHPLEWIDFVGEEHWLALKHEAMDHLPDRIDWAAREKLLTLRARGLGVIP